MHMSSKIDIFQSTLPVWGATTRGLLDLLAAEISIHAPRVGSDARYQAMATKAGIFQSTLPVWGATARYQAMATKAGIFQSTLPVWGATHRPVPFGAFFRISIHAPRVGSDHGGVLPAA